MVFRDGDDLHPPENIDKMASGVPLDDADRQPWLKSIVEFMNGTLGKGSSVVVACSALKKAYRDQLRTADVPPRFIHLVGEFHVIAARQRERVNHFMPPELLRNQFETLEPTEGEADVFEVPVSLHMLEVQRRVLAFAAGA